MKPEVYITKTHRVLAAQNVTGRTLKGFSRTVRPHRGDVSLSGVCHTCGCQTKGHLELDIPLPDGGVYWQRVCNGDWVVEETDEDGHQEFFVLADGAFQYWYQPEPGGNHHGDTDKRTKGED